MTMQPISQVARELGVDRRLIYDRIKHGKIRQAEQILRPGYKRTTWLVDLDEAREHFEAHPLRSYGYRGPAVPAAEPPPPGELTDVQHAVIASEDWHDLVDIQPDPSAQAHIRTYWSDGESYILLPNGEQTGYSYTEAQCPD